MNDSIHSNAGGGIDNDSSGLLTISSSWIAANSTTGNGGGIDNNGFATLVITSSTITGNAAGVRAGGIFNDGTLTVTDCTISDNSTYYGGGIWNTGLMTVTDSTISDNSALRGRRHRQLRPSHPHGQHDLEQCGCLWRRHMERGAGHADR